MNKDRILIVEDDLEWVGNFKRWLGKDYAIDEALTAGMALDYLRTKYYTLVLLDLSLHPSDPDDRTSEEVQNFLKNHIDGTKHIIISGHAHKNDVRKGTIGYKAYDVFFKDEDRIEDVVPFLESVKSAIVDSKKARPNFSKESYEVFCGNKDKDFLEYNIMKILKPKNGINGWFYFKEELLDAISPIYSHMSKNEIAFEENCILGLFWSRQIGSSVTICLSNSNIDEAECRKTVGNWLGWPHTSGESINFESNNIKGYIFIEPDLGPEDFDLMVKGV